VIATNPVDFRKGHDRLAAVARAELGFAPKAGVMVVFRSRRGDRTKVLFWDGSGIAKEFHFRFGLHPLPLVPVQRPWRLIRNRVTFAF